MTIAGVRVATKTAVCYYLISHHRSPVKTRYEDYRRKPHSKKSFNDSTLYWLTNLMASDSFVI